MNNKKQVPETDITLGDTVKDKITGFTGIVIAYDVWDTGCIRIGIESQELKDGKPAGAIWLDTFRVELVKPKQQTVTIMPDHGGFHETKPSPCQKG